MTIRKFTDRSRILTFQRCDRRRWWQYEYNGTGMHSTSKPLPLAVGGSVHVGLTELLRWSMEMPPAPPHPLFSEQTTALANERRAVWVEEQAVSSALRDFATHRTGGFELDLAERAVIEATTAPAVAQGSEPVGAEPPAGWCSTFTIPANMPLTDDDSGPLPEALTRETSGKPGFEAYLWREQCALVEAMVRAYARRRLRPLLEQYEVLEVEREGTWTLVEADDRCVTCGKGEFIRPTDPKGVYTCASCGSTWITYGPEVVFMSRPDALLRNRATNALELLSYKTAASWDVRKARDAERDMQGLSEGIEVERRLAEWWAAIKSGIGIIDAVSLAIQTYLEELDTPPRILAVRYEYLLKGDRCLDKDLSARLGMDARTQRSHLVRQMVCVSTPRSGANVGRFNVGDVCWSYEFHLEDGTSTKLAPANWRPRAAWEAPGGIKGWIDKLDATAMTMSGEDPTVGLEPRPLGYSGSAQAIGLTSAHPLDECFIEPITVYRNDDDLRDLVEQIEASERTVAESAARVHAVAPGGPAEDSGEYRHLLNVLFPQNRQSCEYPTTCPYAATGKQPGPCFGTEQTFLDPLGSERYRERVPHHRLEVEAREAARAESTKA